MSIKLSSSGLISSGDSRTYYFPLLMDSVLRGVSQVMLQNNSYSGLLFLIAIFYNSSLFGMAALIGSLTATLTAIILSVKSTLVRDGLFGFNGSLVAIALIYFLQPTPLAWAYVIFASTISTILMATTLEVLKPWKLPTLTIPFVITSLSFLLATARFGRLQSTNLLPTAGLPKLAQVEGVVTLSTLLEGLLNGLSQVFFQENLITGGLFLLALLVSSRKAFTFALWGSITGLITAWAMGASEPAIRSGAFSFNSVLTAIALGSVFFEINLKTIFYTFLATLMTTIVFATISAALEPLGMPALTLPFVLVVWIFILAGKMFGILRA